MFKRANKITALLVVAASVISVVPAMAATTRLGDKDGNITNAVAYKDGKYLYEGYKSDDEDTGIYYNEGDSDKLLDDIQDSDIKGAFSEEYAFAIDGGNQYLVDLSSGSIIDDGTPEDKADTIATQLKTALKKTDRYGSITLDATNLGYVDSDNVNNIVTGVLPGPKFGTNWYQYSVAPISTADGANNVVTSTGKLYGFISEDGKYIDASNLANIYAYSSTKGKSVQISEFSNDSSDVDSDTGLLATLVSAPKVLTQDGDYIYAKVTVNIYDKNEGSTVEHTYIQKISKAQGSQKDDAYIPKSVISYEVTKGKLDSDDADDAYDAIITNADEFAAVGGQLLAINNTTSNIEVTTINLKKDKVGYVSGQAPASLSSGTKVDVYLAEKDSSDDVDIDNTDGNAIDTDVDGNVWTVANGKIYKFESNKFTQVYSSDSSLDSLSVYDEDNLIAWKTGGDVYTTTSEGKEVTASEAAAVTTTTTTATTAATTTVAKKTGWDKLADGTWNYYDAAGAKAVSKWVSDGGSWYYLKETGVMAASKWVSDGGNWYYLKANGAMATGWCSDNGTWYYLNASGVMLANTTVDGYKLNASGAWAN